MDGYDPYSLFPPDSPPFNVDFPRTPEYYDNFMYNHEPTSLFDLSGPAPDMAHIATPPSFPIPRTPEPEFVPPLEPHYIPIPATPAQREPEPPMIPSASPISPPVPQPSIPIPNKSKRSRKTTFDDAAEERERRKNVAYAKRAKTLKVPPRSPARGIFADGLPDVHDPRVRRAAARSRKKTAPSTAAPSTPNYIYIDDDDELPPQPPVYPSTSPSSSSASDAQREYVYIDDDDELPPLPPVYPSASSSSSSASDAQREYVYIDDDSPPLAPAKKTKPIKSPIYFDDSDFPKTSPISVDRTLDEEIINGGYLLHVSPPITPSRTHPILSPDSPPSEFYFRREFPSLPTPEMTTLYNGLETFGSAMITRMSANMPYVDSTELDQYKTAYRGLVKKFKGVCSEYNECSDRNFEYAIDKFRCLSESLSKLKRVVGIMSETAAIVK